MSAQFNVQAAAMFRGLANYIAATKNLGIKALVDGEKNQPGVPLFGKGLKEKLSAPGKEKEKEIKVAELTTQLEKLAQKADATLDYDQPQFETDLKSLSKEQNDIVLSRNQKSGNYEFKFTTKLASVEQKIDAEGSAGALLKFQSGGTIGAKLKLEGAMQFGYDKDGFFVDAGTGKEPYLAIGAAATLGGSNIKAGVGFLNVGVKDNTSDVTDLDDAYIKAKLKLSDANGDKMLRTEEILLGAPKVKPAFEAGVNLDLRLTGDIQKVDLLPKINTDFKLNWSLNGTKSTLHKLAFENIQLDMSSIVGPGTVIGTVLKPVIAVADVLKPVTDVLTYEVKPLAALGLPATLMDLLAFNPGPIGTIGKLAKITNDIAEFGKTGMLSLGSYTLAGTPGKDALAHPALTKPTQTKPPDDPKLPKSFDDGKKAGFSFPILDNPLTAIGILTGQTVDLVKYKLPELKLEHKKVKYYPLLGPLSAVIPLFGTIAGTAGIYGRVGIGYDTHGLNEYKNSNWKDPARLFHGLYLDDHHGGKDEMELEIKAAVEIGAELNAALLGGKVAGGISGSIGLELQGEEGKFRLTEKIVNADDFGDFLEQSFDFKGKIDAYAYAEWWAGIFKGREEFGRVTLLEFPKPGPKPKSASFSYGEGAYKNNYVLNVGEVHRAKSSLPAELGPDERVLITAVHAPVVIEGYTYPKYAYKHHFNVFLTGASDAGTFDLASNDSWHRLEVQQSLNSIKLPAHPSRIDTVMLGPSTDQARAPAPNKFGVEGQRNFIVGDFGEGNDMLEVATASFPVYSPISVFMGPGNDTAHGGLGADWISGGDGDDVLRGDEGNDQLYGGLGSDVFYPNGSSAGPGGADWVDGNWDVPSGKADPDTGIDRVSYSRSKSGVGINLATGKHSGAAQGDQFFRIEQFEGSNKDDTFTGGSADDFFDGLSGNDVALGGGGNDFFGGAPGADYMDGGNGDRDVVAYWDSPEPIYAEIGDIKGGKGGHAKGDILVNIEWLIGSRFSDTLVGNAAANRLDGGEASEPYADANRNYKRDPDENFIDLNKNKKWDSGFDSMAGGSGNDTYIVSNAADRVVEKVNAGNDVVESAASYTLPANVEHLILTGIVEKSPAPAPVVKKTLGAVSGIGGITAIKNPAALFGANTGPLLALLRESLFDLNGNGNQLDNSLVGNNGDNLLEGREGKDTLVGNEGNDYLNGGQGADRMIGGAGNDTYVVDKAPLKTGGVKGQLSGDWITEDFFSGGVADTVLSSVSYELADNVEILRLTGSASINGTGNVRANTIEGNGANNTLRGGGGRDSLVGKDGNDYLDGFDNKEAIIDIGADLGPDTLVGGKGNDTYIAGDSVYGGYDIIVELANEGTDLVLSPISAFTLPAHVENLLITGKAPGNGTGNGLANLITGNDAANLLDGAGGSDTLIGGKGDDTYIVSVLSSPGSGSGGPFAISQDWIVEAANQGTDEVRSPFSLTLPVNFENLLLLGSLKADGTGNAVANRLTGNSAANRLDGLAGADTMVGGIGNDTYIVDVAGDLITETANGGTDEVRSPINYALAAGSHIEDLVLTGAAINGAGNGLANRITGNSAGNRLDGGAGADTMAGGAGNDTYVVDNAGDVIIEEVNAGTDEVRSFANYTLTGGAHIEQLLLFGAAVNGAGNELANRITGNDQGNLLDGRAGADTMVGGIGNDSYVVDTTGDVVVELADAGTDEVSSSIDYDLELVSHIENLVLTGSADSGLGNELANRITGNRGDNLLDGRAGVDTMVGGIGNDTYIVDVAGDLITETANGGTDEVRSPINYALAAGSHVEDLILTGAATNGGGNELANRITGNALANVLNGGAGKDTLVGGAGNDTYVVDNAGDVVVEAAGGGVDTVRVSSASHSLDKEVENLELVGILASGTGTGNELANRITGRSAGQNQLYGGGGNDTLIGGSGVDALLGNDGDDSLVGGAGDDVLDGGAGNDTMVGGAGNDFYVLNDEGDVVVEEPGGGSDTIRVLTTYVLGAGSEVENIVLGGSAETYHATGNDGNNSLLGNDGANSLAGGGGNDTLDGSNGADTLIGGAGDDAYVLSDSASPGGAPDTVVEGDGAGTDTVFSSLPSYVLTDHVENLVLQGDQSIAGTGNDLRNRINGNSGANTLLGCAPVGAGGRGQIDTLTGGAGADIFVLGAKVGTGRDAKDVVFYDDGDVGNPGFGDYALITDFTPGIDKLQLAGSSGSYSLGNLATVDGVAGYALSASREMIAFIQSPSALTRENTIDQASFV